MKPATIPANFIGTWAPPFPEYGTKLLSPPIVLTYANWPVGAITPTDSIPQFATDTGQQIGQEFFTYGTKGTVVGNPNKVVVLGNNWDQGNLYGAAVGTPIQYFPQVEGVDAWMPISTSPFIALDESAAPVNNPVTLSSLQKVQASITTFQNSPTVALTTKDQTLLNNIVSSLSALVVQLESEDTVTPKVSMSQGVGSNPSKSVGKK